MSKETFTAFLNLKPSNLSEPQLFYHICTLGKMESRILCPKEKHFVKQTQYDYINSLPRFGIPHPFGPRGMSKKYMTWFRTWYSYFSNMDEKSLKTFVYHVEHNHDLTKYKLPGPWQSQIKTAGHIFTQPEIQQPTLDFWKYSTIFPTLKD